MLVQPVSEHFWWCRKYYCLRSCLTRGCLRCLWIAVTGTKFLFTFSKNYTPWSFQFFIPVWNCRATRNKSDASCSGKPWVYLKGALKFPWVFSSTDSISTNALRRLHLLYCQFPSKFPSPWLWMSSTLSISFLESGVLGWTNLDSNNYRQSTIIFHFLCSYHIPHFICLSVSPRSKRFLSRMTYDDSHYNNDSPLSSTEFTLNKPSRFFFN